MFAALLWPAGAGSQEVLYKESIWMKERCCTRSQEVKMRGDVQGGGFSHGHAGSE